MRFGIDAWRIAIAIAVRCNLGSEAPLQTGGSLNMARILVVEDENLLAMEISWMLEDAGYSVVGPERTVETTQKVLSRHKVDLALLDVNLGSELVFPVSRILNMIGTPFIFVTGRSISAIPTEYRHRPLITKPCRPNALITLIKQVLGEHRDVEMEPA